MFNLSNGLLVSFLIIYSFLTYSGAAYFIFRGFINDAKQKPFVSKKANNQFMTIGFISSIFLAMFAPLFFPIWFLIKLPGLKNKLNEEISLKRKLRENASFLKHLELSVRRRGVFYLRELKHPKTVKYLLECLKDEEPSIRLDAAKGLDDLKISIPLEPIVEILEKGNTYFSSSAASILKEQNWVPENETLKFKYYIGLGDVEKLVELGEKVIPPLVEIINCEETITNYMFTAKNAVKCLDRLNWIPIDDKSRFNYSLIKMDVKELLVIGEPVVERVIHSMHTDIVRYSNAMDFLSHIGTEEACRKIMNEIKNRKDPIFSGTRYNPARIEYIQALGEKGGTYLIQPLSGLIQLEEPVEFLSAVIKAISKIIEANGLNSIETILPSDKNSWEKKTGLRMFWSNDLSGHLQYTSKYDYEVRVLRDRGWGFAEKTGEFFGDFCFIDCVGSFIQATANLGDDIVKPLVRKAEDTTLPLLARTIAASVLACIKKTSIQSLSSESLDRLSNFNAKEIEKAHLEILSSEKSETDEKENAVKALGNLRSTMAVEKLSDILKLNKLGDKPNAMLRASAVQALGKIGDEKVIPIIVEGLLNQEKFDISVNGPVYDSWEEKTIYRAIHYRIDANYRVRFHAAHALGNFSGKEVLEALKTCVDKEKRDDVSNQARKSILKV